MITFLNYRIRNLMVIMLQYDTMLKYERVLNIIMTKY